MIFFLSEKAGAETWCRQLGGCNRMVAHLLNTHYVCLLFPEVFLSHNPLASLLLTVIPIHIKTRCHGLSVLLPSIQGMV